MWYTAAYNTYVHNVLFRPFNCLSNSVWHFVSLAKSIANTTIPITNHNDGTETKYKSKRSAGV